MNKRKGKHRAELYLRLFLPPLAPAVNSHLLIWMPQTYSVSPGGDTVHPSATCSHLTDLYSTALQSFHSVQWHPNGILFSGTGRKDTASVQQICLLTWEERRVKAESLEDVANAAQCSVNGWEIWSTALVNTATVSDVIKRRFVKQFHWNLMTFWTHSLYKILLT